MGKNEPVELRRKLVKSGGKGAIIDLPKNVRLLDPFRHRERLWLVDGELNTWVREKKGWRQLGPDGKKLWHKAQIPGGEGIRDPLPAGDRMLFVSTAGRIFELADEKWSLVHHPGKEIPIQAAATAWDPSKERIVAWHGGKAGTSSRSRAERTTTWAFEKGAWRLVFEEQTRLVASKTRLIFDKTLGHIVRLWEEDVGVLVDDRWELYHPKNYEPDWQHVYQDPVTGEVLTEHPLQTEMEYARFDIGRCDAAAFLGDSPLEGAEAGTEKALDEASEKGFAHWYERSARATVTEARASPDLVISVDLGPAFEAAKKLGPRTKLGGGAKPKPPKGKKGA